jgi:hypothetical protein
MILYKNSIEKLILEIKIVIILLKRIKENKNILNKIVLKKYLMKINLKKAQ